MKIGKKNDFIFCEEEIFSFFCGLHLISRTLNFYFNKKRWYARLSVNINYVKYKWQTERERERESERLDPNEIDESLPFIESIFALMYFPVFFSHLICRCIPVPSRHYYCCCWDVIVVFVRCVDFVRSNIHKGQSGKRMMIKILIHNSINIPLPIFFSLYFFFFINFIFTIVFALAFI